MKTAALCLSIVATLAGGISAQDDGQAKTEPVYTPGSGVTAPVVVREVKPAYTSTAMRAKIQGTVPLECVVSAKGAVGKVKVLRSLDPGLDEEAVKALKQWKFTPGKKDGKAVAVKVEVEMTFTLRPEPKATLPVAPIKPPGR